MRISRRLQVFDHAVAGLFGAKFGRLDDQFGVLGFFDDAYKFPTIEKVKDFTRLPKQAIRKAATLGSMR